MLWGRNGVLISKQPLKGVDNYPLVLTPEKAQSDEIK